MHAKLLFFQGKSGVNRHNTARNRLAPKAARACILCS